MAMFDILEDEIRRGKTVFSRPLGKQCTKQTHNRVRKLGVEKKNQLDATEWFIALIICSTCFGHFYAHHQELETICVFLIFIVPCIVIFYGITNRCHNVQ